MDSMPLKLFFLFFIFIILVLNSYAYQFGDKIDVSLYPGESQYYFLNITNGNHINYINLGSSGDFCSIQDSIYFKLEPNEKREIKYFISIPIDVSIGSYSCEVTFDATERLAETKRYSGSRASSPEYKCYDWSVCLNETQARRCSSITTYDNITRVEKRLCNVTMQQEIMPIQQPIIEEPKSERQEEINESIKEDIKEEDKKEYS